MAGCHQWPSLAASGRMLFMDSSLSSRQYKHLRTPIFDQAVELFVDVTITCFSSPQWATPAIPRFFGMRGLR